MPYGFHGRVLHVDLTTGKTGIENPAEDFYRKYGGGSGLGMYYLLKNTPPGTDPLAPENCLSFFVSPITGAAVGGLSRVNVTAKSPLSGLVGDSQAGGFFPAALKRTGFDGIVINGRASEPVYLLVDNQEVSLEGAKDLMGRPTAEVEAVLTERHGKKARIVQTGIAGENGVLYAALMNMANRANGRTGMGAVMGSKNLKAIVVIGSQKTDFYNADPIRELAKWGVGAIPDGDMAGLGEDGTSGLMEDQNEAGGLPSYNWTSGHFEEWKALDASTMKETMLKERDTCFACPVKCKRVVEVPDGPHPVDPVYGGPEYETISTLGTLCGLNDLKDVAYANQLCNAWGIDTISVGGTIAWAMECFEKGILTAKETDGLELRFGNAEAVFTLLDKIARREGFGDLLADGSARAAEVIGKDSEKLVVAVKKVELPAHMPQVKPGLGTIYMVNPFGPDHQSSEHDAGYSGDPDRAAMLGLTDPQPEEVLNDEKIAYMHATHLYFSALDCYSVCNFVFGPAWQLYGPDHFLKLVRGVTGWDDVTIEEIQEVGERRINMMRAFNAREGAGKAEDVLPEKLFVPLKGGASDGMALDREEMNRARDVYYGLAGWDADTGNPDADKLASLGLDWIA